MQKGEIIQLEIQKLAYKGLGIGYYDQRIVFVPFTIPGQVIEAQIIKRKKHYAEGRLIQVVTKALNERPAKCPHFAVCGGCSFQTLPYEKQKEAKKQFVEESLHAAQKMQDFTIEDPLSAPNEYEYRNKMEFTFGENISLGLHPKGKFYEVINLDACPISSQNIQKILHATQNIWRQSYPDIPNYHKKRHTGILRLLQIRDAYVNRQTLINIMHSTHFEDNSQKERFQDFLQDLKAAYASIDPNIHMLVTVNNHLNEASGYETPYRLMGQMSIQECVGDKYYEIGPFSFFQTNSRGTKVLYNTIKDLCKESGSILDLYCGAGTIGQYVSDIAHNIVGIDSEPSAIENANRNAQINGIQNSTYYLGKAEDILKTMETHRFDVVIIDPPRAGLHPKALEWITQSLETKEIIYVSCNPTTLGRDLCEFIQNGYTIQSVTPVDMFPQTYHVETIVRISK